jgi:membrane protease YdiL (CAAX protease family)
MENENANPPLSAPPASPTPRVSILEAALVMVTIFLLLLFLVSIIFLVNEPIALIVNELVILIVPLSFLLLKRINVKDYVRGDFKAKFVLLGIGTGFILLFIDIAIASALTAVFGTSQAIEQENALLTDLSKTPTGFAAVAISIILAGFCEEFAFRGFLQSAINRRYSFLPAVFVSAAVFGLFHFDPQLIYIFSTFVAGLFLGYIYHRWDSYVVVAVAHTTLDVIVLISLLLAVA